MSKIVKNTTASSYDISDVGITIPASSQYTIPQLDYLLWAASDDVIVGIGAEDLVINDGSSDLSISDGTDLIKGIFPSSVTVENENVEISFSEGAVDAFGRQRVSEVVTLFEMTAGGYPDYTRYMSATQAGGGTLTGASNGIPSMVLGVGTASGDSSVIRTRRAIEYNKGHGQQVLFTGKFGEGKTNLTQRFGYYDTDHGLFFEMDDTTMKVVVRSSLTGSVVDTSVAQSSWNRDTLDGSGDADNPSGLTLDKTKQTVFSVDFGWLGSYKVRFYIAIGEKIVLVHTFEFSNLLTVPYMNSGQAPIRAEIINTGTTASSSDLYVTCSSVKSEGSPVHIGQIRSVDTGTTSVGVLNGTESVIAGIRLKSDYLEGSVKPLNFTLLPISGNSFIYYKVIYNPTFTSTDTWADLPGICQGLTNTPTYSGGSIIDSGYLSMGNKNQASLNFDAIVETDIFLGTDLDGTADALILVVEGLSGTGDLLFSGKYREFI